MNHRLLDRQLKRCGLSPEALPSNEAAWHQFLESISRTYHGGDRDRYLLERSLSISSEEMQQLYHELQRSSESRLAAERNRLRTVISSLGAGLCTLDPEGHVQSINPEGERLLHWAEADLKGQHFFELICPAHDTPAAGATAPEQALAAGRPYQETDGVFARRDGTILPVSCTLNPILEEETVRGAVLVFFDITERKRYEERLVAAKEKAEEMTRLKDAFLTNMSHEIRTPLSAMIGFADLLLNEVPEAQRESVTFIQEGGRRLLETLTDVLDLARLEAEGFDLRPEPVDVRLALRKATGLFSSLARKKALDLRIDLPAVPVYIEVDPTGLGRILSNLLSNAIKFTETGRVVVRACADETSVHIEVDDTGVGIDAAFLPHLFDEFKQESTGLTRSHEGAGLGLAITKRLVALMKGRIAVQSTKGQGTRFTLSFPRAQASTRAKNLREQHGKVPHSASSPRDPRPGQREPLQILVAEDNVVNQKVILRLLERLGHTADVVADGLGVLTALGRARYDVILMDVQMPEMNGLEATRQICTRYDAAARPRIIAVTANAMAGDRERCLDAGMDDYLSKPVQLDDLEKVLRQCLPLRTANPASRARAARLPNGLSDGVINT